MTIFYEVNDNLYINLTNKCHCACTFCVRNESNGVGDGNNLWLEKEPTLDEVKKAFDDLDISKYNEIVFCGFGEPLERLDSVIEVSKFLKEKTNKKIRINTNGLSDLINEKPTAHLLEGLIDSISISLNASDSEKYSKVCLPSFGEKSFEAILDFAKDCKKYIPSVTFTVVDCMDSDEIEKCRKIANEIGVNFRIRAFI